MLSAGPHDAHRRCGRDVNVTNDIIIFTHVKVTTTHQQWWTHIPYHLSYNCAHARMSQRERVRAVDT